MRSAEGERDRSGSEQRRPEHKRNVEQLGANPSHRGLVRLVWARADHLRALRAT